MTTFRKFFLNNELFVSGLEKRGFSLNISDGEFEGDFTFTKMVPGNIHISLHFTPWESTAFRCGLIISSIDVTNVFYACGLFLDRPIISRGRAYDVLAAELLWLKWNADSDAAQKFEFDYELNKDLGVRRMFDDLDSVGQMFLSGVSTPRRLADFLISIEKYPNRIKWGGQPKSSDPFIFASALYLALGDRIDASKALDLGLIQYEVFESRAEWQAYRLEKFQERRSLLLAEIA